MTWLAPGPMPVEQEARVQLAKRYAAVRLWTASAALPLALVVSLVSGEPIGFQCAIISTGLLLHSIAFLRSRTSIGWALAVDATTVGMISFVTRLPVVAGMGSAFVAVTASILAQGRVRRRLLTYVAAWLAIALAVSLGGEEPRYGEPLLHLLTTLGIVFFLVSIAATATLVMTELDRRDRARHEASRVLRQSEERFRTLVQDAFDAVAVADADGQIVYASDSYERVTGFPRSQRLEPGMGGRIHPDDVHGAQQVIERSYRHRGETMRHRMRVRGEDDGWRTLELAVTNLLDNPAIAGLVCNQRDVTQQVQAEEALRASEHRFRGAFENAPIGMALLSFDGRFLQVNQALADLLGYPAESLLSMNWADVDTPQGSGTAEEVAALLAGPTLSRQMERCLVRADGSARDCTVSLSVVADARERPHHLILQMVDITELKRAQQELEEALRGKDEFVASVSHELRTPLTAVIGFGDLLRTQAPRLSPQEQREMIEVLRAQAAEMARIVEDLLVVARSDGSEIRVASLPVDLRDQAVQVLSGWGPAQVAHVALEDGTGYAQADPSRVRQILRNLVLNALRYGGEHVRIGTRRVGDAVCIVVADDGPGIPDHARERVFQPYQQAHRVPGLTSSIGIGLTVSRRLARLMGGDLTYRYEHGEAVFELALPARPDEAHLARVLSARPGESAPAGRSTHPAG